MQRRSLWIRQAHWTKGQFAVTKIMAVNESEQRVLAYGAFAERLSTHPISKSIMAAYQQKNGDMTIMSSNEAVEEKAGFGVIARKDSGKIAVGNEKLMAHVLGAEAWAACKEKYLAGEKALSEGTICHVAYNDTYWGFLLIEDQLKEDAADCVTELKKSRYAACYADRETRRVLQIRWQGSLVLQSIMQSFCRAIK